MRLIALGSLPGRSVALSPRESVAVLHQVCRLSHVHAQAGQSFPWPRLADLSVSELGAIVINPSAALAGSTSESLTSLIDELLPEEMPDRSFLPAASYSATYGAHATRSTLASAADEDAVVLQSLFARACAAGIHPWLHVDSAADDVSLHTHEPRTPRVLEFAPTSEPAAHAVAAPPLAPPVAMAAPAPIAERSELDDWWRDIASRPYVAPPDEDDAADEATPDRSAAHTESPDDELRLDYGDGADSATDRTGDDALAAVARPWWTQDRPWLRRAVAAGVLVNLALAAAIVWPPSPEAIAALVARVTREAAVESGFDRPPAEAPLAADARRPTTSDTPPPDDRPPLASAARPPAGVVLSLASHPDATLLASAGAVSVPGMDDADDPTLSPNGALVAFVSDRDWERGVFVAHRDGGNVIRASGEGRASAPAWSPDSQRLAFVRAETDEPTVWNLWLRDIPTGELRRLTSHTRGIVRGASWFPDGHRLCYGYGSRLYVLDIRSGAAHPLASPAPGAIRTPSVSPDGERVAFDVEGDGIWMLHLARGSMERVVDEPSASGLAWGPRGSRLVYYSLQAREWRAWQRDPRS